MVSLALLALLSPGCGFWVYEEPVDPDHVSWSGTVLDGPHTGENGVLTGGEVTAWDLDGELLAEGEEPWADSPGTWRLEVPPEVPVALHLAGEGMLPAVWRGTTPGSVGYWYTGALFAYEEEAWLPFFEQFEGQHGISIPALADGICWAWFAPLVPEDWAGAQLRLTDGTGARIVLLTYTLDDEGFLVDPDGGPVDHAFAFGLAPGDATLAVRTADGGSLVETWPCWPGEVVTGWYLALPEEAS